MPSPFKYEKFNIFFILKVSDKPDMFSSLFPWCLDPVWFKSDPLEVLNSVSERNDIVPISTEKVYFYLSDPYKRFKLGHTPSLRDVVFIVDCWIADTESQDLRV